MSLPLVNINAQYLESSKTLGIDHISVSPGLIGGGVVSFDYNNDGWQDLYFTSGINKDVLYKNINGEEFELVDLPALAFTGRFNTSGVISADFNNDGCDDLLVTTLSEDPTLLFINNCDDSFTLEYLHIKDSDDNYISSAGAFASDFNEDGLLDIYLLNYVKEHHFLNDSIGRVIGYDHDCFKNSILINRGEFLFEQMTQSDLIDNAGCTLAGSSSRFLGPDNNGVYIVNDFGEWIYPNQLLDPTNDNPQGLGEAIYGMGVAVSDFDNDEDYDIYLTNIGKNKFLVNENDIYSNEAQSYNIENEWVNDTTFVISWGTMFLDFDNDSKLDLFVANGYVSVPEFLSSSIVNQNKLYRNDIDEFTDITEVAGLASNGIHRGAIITDINNDGSLDIITPVVSGTDLGTNDIKRSKVFINEFDFDNNYLQIYLEGIESNRNGYNAEVKVYKDTTVYSQLLLSGTTYASQSFPSLHFGLGTADQVDSIKVIWPSDVISIYRNVDTNQKLLLREGAERELILGCTDEGARNYMENADVSFGCINKSTSTTEHDPKEILIYPNPSNGNFGIDISASSNIQPKLIQVYNSLGQKVFVKRIESQQDLEKIVLKNLSAGSYHVQLITAGGKILSETLQIIR